MSRRTLANWCYKNEESVSHCHRVVNLDVPETGPPLMPCLRGTICRLADRPWPLETTLGLSTKLPWLVASSKPPSLAPIDIIETERLCGPPSFAAFDGCPASHELDAGCDRKDPAGTLRESVDL